MSLCGACDEVLTLLILKSLSETIVTLNQLLQVMFSFHIYKLDRIYLIGKKMERLYNLKIVRSGDRTELYKYNSFLKIGNECNNKNGRKAMK